VLTRTLVGHELGVWGLCLVSSGGYRLDKSKAKRKKNPGRGKASKLGIDGDGDMPSEYLESFVTPAMRMALGLDLLTESEREESGSEDEHFVSDDSTKRQNRARKEGTEEESGPRNEPRNSNKPSSMCYASQGWGQPNSLIVSGGCDKVVRVWDTESGQVKNTSLSLLFPLY
jgi:F-box and WD-40 domain protein CDC4